MSAPAWRSDKLVIGPEQSAAAETETLPQQPRRQRAESRVSLGVALAGGRTIIRDKGEAGSARVRLPRVPGAALEAVLINTAGGLAEGDHVVTSVHVGAGADLVVTTPAAEKIYRSEGAIVRLDVTLKLGSGARLDWVPQETILYNHARLTRRLDVEMATDAALMLFEATVFGRTAHNEIVEDGLFEDRWRIRRGGGLVYADTFRLAGAIADTLHRPSVADGARALGTLLYVAPDAGARIEEARALLAEAGSECGAGTWNGCLAIRLLAPDIETLRRDAARVMTGLGGRTLPRVWHL
jgi:urease accessory protein